MTALSNRFNRRIIVFLLAFGLMVGCAGMKTYPNRLDKNLHIATETDSRSIFSKVHASVDIYRVDANCNTEFEGTVSLKQPSVDVGIPSGRLSYLVFVFERSGLLASSSGTITYDALLKPRAGYTYDVNVRYKENIYNVEIRETHPNKKMRSEIVLKRLNACRESRGSI